MFKPELLHAAIAFITEFEGKQPRILAVLRTIICLMASLIQQANRCLDEKALVVRVEVFIQVLRAYLS
jgi:hypothetical protein